MFEREIKYYPLFRLKAATGHSIPVDVRDFKCAQITAVARGGAALTIKVKASLQKEPPDFTAAASGSNQWAYVQVVDLSDGNFFAGAAGYTFAADIVKQFELNTNGITWFCLEVSAYTSGKLDADATITSNI